jgi:hypothetical protein
MAWREYIHAYDRTAVWKPCLSESANAIRERMQAGEWEWDRGWMGVVAEGQREEDKVSGKKSSKPGGNTGRNTGRGTGGQESVKPGGKKRSDGKEGRGRLMRLFTGGRK